MLNNYSAIFNTERASVIHNIHDKRRISRKLSVSSVALCVLRGLIAFVMLISCNDKKTTENKSWTAYLENIGTYSSARMVDLNNDGTLDVVIGAGGREEVYTDSAVLALDGKTGNRLWAIGGSNQYVGSAVFADITGDQKPDVIIGGRWALLSAIDGANGKLVWSFYADRKKPDGSDGGWYNFTTPQWVPDQDKDGVKDILIANGGDAKAAPVDPNRPAGRLLVLSGKTGRILANVEVPDGKETYLSVLCEMRGADDMTVLFGTGGETLGGHLYKTTLKDIMTGNISGAKAIAASEVKGFVSSPVMVDINRDGVRDVVVNAVDGRMMVIDGKTDSVIFQLQLPGTEAYTMPAIGHFTNDSIPDLYANFAIGTFPMLQYSVRFMVDGATGKIEYRDTIPAFQYASGITADLDGDGYDEVLVNQSALKRTQFDRVYYSRLQVLDFHNNKNYALGDSLPATNLASTPWIGDMDGDGQFDIICSAVRYKGGALDMPPLGLYINRYAAPTPIKKSPRWGAFMGSDYTGSY